jgi:hypothetical protein
MQNQIKKGIKIMRTIKVEACVSSLRTLSISELNYLADRLVEVDSAVADQLQFAIDVAVREQDLEESIAA